MTRPRQPTERFAQHSRLFLAGLLYQEPGGPLRRATSVASRDGDLVAYDAGEVVEPAGHRGRRSVNEVGIELLHHWFLPHGSAPVAITGSEVLGVVPLEVTDALLDEFHRLADHHERGFLAEQVIELLARAGAWSVHHARSD